MTGHASPPAGGARRLAALLSASEPRGVKRMIALALFVPGLVLLQLLHRIGFALDHLLFPGYRRVDVREPLFIVGMPRSGTSFLHQTLSRDTARFTTLTLWELVLAPSISERAFWAGLAGIDAKLGAPVTRLGRAIERMIVDRMEGVHPVDFEEPGEDFLFLLPLFACFLLVAVFPRSPAIWDLTRIDDWPEQRRRALVLWYRSCLQRHLYWVQRQAARAGRPAPTRVLSKNPSFTACVRTLHDVFPDARFVCCFRPVHEAIPSQLSSLRPAAETFGWDATDPSVIERFVVMYEEFARRSIELAESTRPGTTGVIELADLAADAGSAVARLYDDFGWTPDERFSAALRERTRRSRSYTSRHRYDLDDFGLAGTELDTRFAEPISRLRALARPHCRRDLDAPMEVPA